MKLLVLFLGGVLASSSCVYEESLGPNCTLDCAACGTCDATPEQFCGNDTIDPGEECDGTAVVGEDGCDSNCRNTSCNNGFVEEGESCDSAFGGIGFCVECSQVGAITCGNGSTEANEECDDENLEDRDGCNSDCRLEDRTPAICGNQSIQLGEECDDGNLGGADGCSSECQIESGWSCQFSATGSQCRET